MTRRPANLQASIAARLRNIARDKQADVAHILRHYAIERFLYRLSLSDQRDKFILKGAMLFTAWSSDPFRATQDLDLLGFGDPNISAVSVSVRKVCLHGIPDDGVLFDPATLSAAPIRGSQEYGGVRVKLAASLAKIRIPVQIDIGFGDAITPAAIEIDFPTLLNDPSPRLKAYPKETVVAEKFQAIVALGEVNTRMKDYYDLFTLARLFEFDGPVLAAALRATFERRQTAIPVEPPFGLSHGFASDPRKIALWTAFAHRGSLLYDAGNLTATIESVAEFVMQPATAVATSKAFARQWKPGGPWRLPRKT